jgi:hypothetical protein
MGRTYTIWAALVLALACGAAGMAQSGKEKKAEAAMRSVEGVVDNSDETIAAGAVVQLKNLKTLQVRSFITQADGVYHFYELSPDIDYELKAELNGATSATKGLSSFDSRKKVVINLKLNKK